MADSLSSRMRRWPRLFLAILVITAVGLAGWWAGRATLTDEGSETQGKASTQTVWADATETSVGRTLSLSTTVRQPMKVVASNSLTGVVRKVSPGSHGQGETLFVVGDTPVRAVRADLPFYRDLATGTEGDDVLALQNALRDMGYFYLYPDGDFGEGTEAAVKRWQKDLGQEETGSIQLGELVGISELPTTIKLSGDIAVGKPLVGGEDAVSAPTGERTFVLVVSEQQADLIPTEATVQLSFKDHTWDAVVGQVSANEDLTYDYLLTAPDGGPVCGNECNVLPSDEQVSINSAVSIVPEVSGVGVPAAAVRTGSDGKTYVVTDGGNQTVEVKGSGQGIAIVDGIEAGTEVEIPADATAGAPSVQDPDSTGDETPDPEPTSSEQP